MADALKVVIHCLIYNVVNVTALFLLIRKNPRYMMQDYPEAITRDLPPQTREEKRGGLIYGLPFLLCLLLYPFGFGIYGEFFAGYGFLENWLRIFIIFFSFNVVDLLIVDWFLFCTITPSFLVLPGTEGHKGYKNYRYHFIASLKGTVFAVVGAFLIAGILEGIAFLI